MSRLHHVASRKDPPFILTHKIIIKIYCMISYRRDASQLTTSPIEGTPLSLPGHQAKGRLSAYYIIKRRDASQLARSPSEGTPLSLLDY
jgi:hypothetical protein